MSAFRRRQLSQTNKTPLTGRFSTLAALHRCTIPYCHCFLTPWRGCPSRDLPFGEVRGRCRDVCLPGRIETDRTLDTACTQTYTQTHTHTHTCIYGDIRGQCYAVYCEPVNYTPAQRRSPGRVEPDPLHNRKFSSPGTHGHTEADGHPHKPQKLNYNVSCYP